MAPWDVDNEEDSEFGLGSGLIDPTNRANRILEPWQESAEIAALPKTFDGSLDLQGGRPSVDTTPVPRLLPGETEADRT
jgi:hypothetical protein